MPPKSKSAKKKQKPVARKKKAVQGNDSESESESPVKSAVLAANSDEENEISLSESDSTAHIGPRQKKAPASRKSTTQYCTNGKLDINNCTITALKKKGIPLGIAQKIVRYRKKHKCFVHINELMRVQGVKGEVFTLLTRLTSVGSNANEINSLLKKRKPALAKSKVKASKSKAHTPTTNKSRAPKRHSRPAAAEPRRTRSLSSIDEDRGEHNRHTMVDRWPRGSASLSSVLTISPKVHRSRSRHRGRDMYTTYPSRSHGYMKYDERIPKPYTKSPNKAASGSYQGLYFDDGGPQEGKSKPYRNYSPDMIRSRHTGDALLDQRPRIVGVEGNKVSTDDGSMVVCTIL